MIAIREQKTLERDPGTRSTVPDPVAELDHFSHGSHGSSALIPRTSSMPPAPAGLVLRRVADGDFASEPDPLGDTPAAPALRTALGRGAGRGSALPTELSDSIGAVLGADLSAVRVHTDAEAAGLSRAVAAEAFTYGRDIYFGSGRYAPSSTAGQRLIAHELAHVAQVESPHAPAGAPMIGRADDPMERAADRTATRVMAVLRRRAAAPDSIESNARTERTATIDQLRRCGSAPKTQSLGTATARLDLLNVRRPNGLTGALPNAALIRRKLDLLAESAPLPEQQIRIQQAQRECGRHIEVLEQSTAPGAKEALAAARLLLDTLDPKKNADMREVKTGKAREVVNGAIAKLNANIDAGLVPDAPPPVIAQKQQLKADRKQKAQVKDPSAVTTKDVSADVLKRGKVVQLPENFAFRANTAVVARKYLLDGFSIVHNDKNEKQLGPGLYAGMKIEYAREYVDRLKDLPAIVQLLFTEPATGIEVQTAHMELLDGKGVDAMQRIYDEYDFIYCNDALGGQIKFHPRYYLTKIKIGKVRVRVNKSADKWEEYAPDVFLQDYESSHVNLRVGAAKQRGALPKAVAPTEPPNGAWTQALKEAPDAEKWMMESIRYRDAAERFEANLAGYASSHKLALDEAEKLVTAVWKLFPNADQSDLGTENRDVTGMVGKVRKDIEKVAISGNLRERMAFLYNGYTSRLFEKLNSGKELARPPELKTERAERKNRTSAKGPKTTVNPLDVSPPLSPTEWLFAVDNKGELGWEPGANRYEFQMASEFQKIAEGKGALVSTGTSGTAYGILHSAQLIGAKSGADVDYRSLRLALLGWMLSAGDHTFHEIMVACEMFDKTLAYENNFRRYRSIAPISEADLRQHVADGNRFPDEFLDDTIHEVKAFNLIVESIMLRFAGSEDKANMAYKAGCAEFDQAAWSSRLKELSAIFDKLGTRGQLLLSGDTTGADTQLLAVRKTLEKYGIRL